MHPRDQVRSDLFAAIFNAFSNGDDAEKTVHHKKGDHDISLGAITQSFSGFGIPLKVVWMQNYSIEWTLPRVDCGWMRSQESG